MVEDVVDAAERPETAALASVVKPGLKFVVAGASRAPVVSTAVIRT